MDSITRKAADFVANLDMASVPPEAIHAARIGIVDCVGVMLAGAREPAVDLVAGIATPASGESSNRSRRCPI
jgi:2-methylcitrate dehydratase PrpD